MTSALPWSNDEEFDRFYDEMVCETLRDKPTDELERMRDQLLAYDDPGDNNSIRRINIVLEEREFVPPTEE